MSARRTILAAVFALGSLGGLAAVTYASVLPTLGRHASSAKDLLPLYLGAHTLADGRDPNDPRALEDTFHALGLRTRVGGFFSYYPATASVLALPARRVPFHDVVRPTRLALVASLVGAAALGALAGAGPGPRTPAGRLLLVGVVASAVMYALALRISPAILRIAQPGPLAALFTGLGLWALARQRDALAGAAIGLGAAIKLFPALLLLPALGARRWRVPVVAALVVGGLVAVAFAHAPGIGFPTGGLSRFVAPEPVPAWEPWLLDAWRYRVAIVPLTAGVLAWAAWRRAPPAPAAVVAVAGGGVLLAGTHHPHELVQIVPALAYLVGGAARGRRGELLALAGVLGVGAALRVVGPAQHAPTLLYLPFALAVWGAAVVRLANEARDVAHAARGRAGA